MHRSLVSLALAAFAVVSSGAAVAQSTPPPASGNPAAVAAAASSPASKPAQRKRVRRMHKPIVVAPGVTGGTPETSARTPGGPPLDTPNGLTVPIPSLKK
jgi:hypothetical protein